jgi:hypothetical protein
VKDLSPQNLSAGIVIGVSGFPAIPLNWLCPRGAAKNIVGLRFGHKLPLRSDFG